MSQNVKRPALGQGLSALLGPDIEKAQSVKLPEGEKSFEASPNFVSIHKVVSGKYQPRKTFDEYEIEQLAQSIRENGIIQPIIVRATASDEYEIIAGERRWRAADRAGLEYVPVIVRQNISDQQALEIALLENVQRQDLDTIEEAEGYQRLIQEFGYTQEAIAHTLGKSRPHVANTLRLLNLPPLILVYLREKKLSPGHARVLLSLDKVEAEEIAKLIIKKNLTVRQTERLIKNIHTKDVHPRISKGPLPHYKPEALVELEQIVQKVFQAPCQILENKAGIQLTITFKNYDHFDQFLNKVAE